MKQGLSDASTAHSPGTHHVRGLVWFLRFFALWASLPGGAGAAETANEWIPLPYWREGAWWLPVEAERPRRIEANFVTLIGNTGYQVSREGRTTELLDRQGNRITQASSFDQFDADRVFFLPDRGGNHGIVNLDGRVERSPDPALNDYMTRYRLISAAKASPAAKEIVPARLTSPWLLASNAQPPVRPNAISYCQETGLMAVVQQMGASGAIGGSELRVWDVR